ncbi:GRAM domain-containing protein 2B [Engraulis encrasicolus]|uniref:GRAM domain-containing protein 2B n=1 Tax=Engraulis encrasicolus TaxID=184585 RepID=UPI002FD339B4
MERHLTSEDCALSSNHRRNFSPPRPACSTCKVQAASSNVRSDTEHGGEERQSRAAPNGRMAFSDPQSESLRRKRKPVLVRSKTFDPSLLSQVQSDPESKPEVKKSQPNQLSKTNLQYHKLFKEISNDEPLKQSYTCALQKDILYQGRLFVSDNWICFHSKVFGKDTKIVISVLSVAVIKKTKTAILVPNALVIATSNERYVFCSFLSRDTTYKCLMSVCYHLEEKTGLCPMTPPPECRFQVDHSATLPLVRKRRQVMEDSSSSDSQSPDIEKITAYSHHPQTFLKVTNSAQVSVAPEIVLQHTPETRNSLPCVAETEEIKFLRTFSLSTLLMCYLFVVSVLVFSSCYMAFRILSLEQRLISLSSMTNPPDNSNEDKQYSEDNSDVYAMISMNLLKLEQLQRNLQRLLEKTQGGFS